MNSPVVLDSSALVAIALGEKRGERAKRVIREAPGQCFIHAVNAFEVFVVLARNEVSQADAWRAVSFGGVLVVDEIPEEMTLRAAALKIAHEHLSLGDCHCVAFAEEMGGCLLTTDERLASVSTSINMLHLM